LLLGHVVSSASYQEVARARALASARRVISPAIAVL
jgi:hypothetical protein